MNFTMYSPGELAVTVGSRARELRLAKGLRQTDVAAAAGVPVSTLKRFESRGDARFGAVVRIALALGAERAFAELFPALDTRSLDDILRGNRKRIRARKKS
ncbi:MAG TPA: helix-turn-helix transcriptional regulator [Candidatus Elarobacter sp.]|jgi:transcriptional regulator with XRE-family HTH domain